MTTENDASGLVGKILLAAKNAPKKQNKEVGPLIKQLRVTLGLSPAEFAARLGISVPTVSRWEDQGGKSPPWSRLQKLRDLLKPGSGLTAPRDYVLIKDTPVCIRPIEFILEREKEAKEVWLTKFLTEFLSGIPGKPRETMCSLLREKKDLQFKFFFRGPKEEFDKLRSDANHTLDEEKCPLSAFPALVSFAHFKRSLLQTEANHQNKTDPLSARVHGWVVSPDEAYKIGVSVHAVGTAVVVYETPKEDGRKVDVFIELPAAVCDPDKTDRTVDGSAYLCWVQLPAREAERLWLTWEKALRSIAKSETEVCKELTEFDRFTLPVM